MILQKFSVLLIFLVYLILIFLFFYHERLIFNAYNNNLNDCSWSRPCTSLCSNKNEFSDEEIKANITKFVKFQDYEKEVDNFTIHWTQLTCKHFDFKNIENNYKSLNISYVS